MGLGLRFLNPLDQLVQRHFIQLTKHKQLIQGNLNLPRFQPAISRLTDVKPIGDLPLRNTSLLA